MLYKKPKKSVVGSEVVELSAGPLDVGDIEVDGFGPVRSWGSEINNETSSISGISDVENIKNTFAEETSYADLNSEMDDAIAIGRIIPFDKIDDYPNQLSKLPKKSQPPNDDNNLQKEPLNFFLDHYLEDILHPKSPPQNLPVPQKLPPFRLRINPQPPQSSSVVMPTPTMNN
ncbi:hypothetical protein G9A89_009272 [Geosiphon pyriformis]|nr:hypothetical protein G9A89_009272 [Geosiphon pyriformis]